MKNLQRIHDKFTVKMEKKLKHNKNAITSSRTYSLDFNWSYDPNTLLMAIILAFSTNDRLIKDLHSVAFTVLMLAIIC